MIGGWEFARARISRSRKPDKRTMNEKKAYPLRINAKVLAAVQRWADDELRSVNAQIEYVLRDALRKAGRYQSESIPDSEDEE